MDILDARRLAHDLLSVSLPQRWRHVTAVAAEAERIADTVVLDRNLLVCSAWLHDVGYSPALHGCGFHPLDGARYLRAAGWPTAVCELVAHHSCARVEARHRGVDRTLCAEFIDRGGVERDALWAADATTGPAGQRFTLGERVAEVITRYGEGHLVSRCMRLIRPELDAAIAATTVRMLPPDPAGQPQ